MNPLRRTTTVPGISTRKESQPPAASGKSAAKQDPEKKEEEEKVAAASTRSRSQSPSVAVSPKVRAGVHVFDISRICSG